jgi:hypothetical protein
MIPPPWLPSCLLGFKLAFCMSVVYLYFGLSINTWHHLHCLLGCLCEDLSELMRHSFQSAFVCFHAKTEGKRDFSSDSFVFHVELAKLKSASPVSLMNKLRVAENHKSLDFAFVVNSCDRWRLSANVRGVVLQSYNGLEQRMEVFICRRVRRKIYKQFPAVCHGSLPAKSTMFKSSSR